MAIMFTGLCIGSGNGLAWSLGAVDAVTAAFFIIKGTFQTIFSSAL
jgi:hypothetical protein